MKNAPILYSKSKNAWFSKWHLLVFVFALSWYSVVAVLAEENEHAEVKQVLALQAFLPEEESESIEALCLKAVSIGNANVAFTSGAVPHVTISAWSVTATELEISLENLKSIDLSYIEPVLVNCRLHREAEGSRVGWYLIPSDDARPAIDAFRNKAMAALNLDFEDYDGRSGEDWWPHLTLFSVPISDEGNVKNILEQIEEIAEIRLNVLALVGFESNIHTLATNQLEKH